MLIVMKPGSTVEEVQRVCERATELGGQPQVLHGSDRIAIANGNTSFGQRLSGLPGVACCIEEENEWKLVRRRPDNKTTVVEVRGERIGEGALQIIAGPCAVESREQILRTAEAVARAGVRFLRGGAYKPRTSPYSFQGLREEGLVLLDEMRRSFDLRIVTEVKDTESLPAVAQVADVLQIGSRNMHNYSLLEAVGRVRRPVLLKRGMSATLKELFMAAEYLLALGCSEVILCERGIRTFETMTRNTFDVSAIPMMRHHTHLPIVADPSHGVGVNWAVPALARAAIVAGADAVMVEVHPDPSRALSDGHQALSLDQFEGLMREMRSLGEWRRQHQLPDCVRPTP
jgi:3-deoxy-7-phosphoheptulonate synthase